MLQLLPLSGYTPTFTRFEMLTINLSLYIDLSLNDHSFHYKFLIPPLTSTHEQLIVQVIIFRVIPKTQKHRF